MSDTEDMDSWLHRNSKAFTKADAFDSGPLERAKSAGDQAITAQRDGSDKRWAVELPSGDIHDVLLVKDHHAANGEDQYVGACDCDGFRFNDPPCAHLCSLLWKERNSDVRIPETGANVDRSQDAEGVVHAEEEDTTHWHISESPDLPSECPKCGAVHCYSEQNHRFCSECDLDLDSQEPAEYADADARPADEDRVVPEGDASSEADEVPETPVGDKSEGTATTVQANGGAKAAPDAAPPPTPPQEEENRPFPDESSNGKPPAPPSQDKPDTLRPDEEAFATPLPDVPEEYVMELNGETYIRRAGYARLLKQAGMRAVVTEKESNEDRAVYLAKILDGDGNLLAQDVGSAGPPSNEDMDGAEYNLHELAITRAKTRAASWATGAGLTALVEVDAADMNH